MSTAACSGSVLVRPDDATFAEATRRYARTEAQVAAEAPRAPEAPLFMQAEAFYRYRFEPPARSFGNLLMQALAVATEFAPLQALAASAGMFELRLRAHDGAVQLWEGMLARHPGTPLRPLTLYRLGWAYRSVSTDGFPRDTSEEAFEALLRDHPTSPLAPLAREALTVPYKTQETAIGLSIVPGLGQMYAGEYANGAARLGLALAFAALAVVPIVVLYRRYDDDNLRWRRDWPWLATSLGGIILLNVAYTTAYQDAQRAAVQWNERAEAAFDRRHPDAP
jgi:hypothetical protein